MEAPARSTMARKRAAWRAVALASLALAAAAAPLAGGSHDPCAAPTCYTRVLAQRVLASPFPLGPATVLSDEARFLVVADEATSVQVNATARSATAFFLRYHREGEAPAGSPVPSLHQVVTLRGGVPWVVHVDPAAGVLVDVVVTFRGSVGNGGAPRAFTLADLGFDRACLGAPMEACLP